MKQLLSFIGGIILTVFGIFLLLSNINVSSLSFCRVGGINSAPILIILLIISIVVSIVSDKKFWWVLVFADIVLIIVSVILGTRFSFKYMSAFDLVLMIGVFAVGLGLVLKGLIGSNKGENL